MRWRRLDVPGREQARVERTADGWRLTGELDVEEAGTAARLHYAIDCDPEWRTRSAVIEGEVNGGPVRFALEADRAGNWRRDGAPVPELAGALDVDLGFTPATNTLPIRRLGLSVGERAPVRSAWLRFPELRLEPLEQTYTREAEQSFRYRALVDGEPFVARLDTDAFGRVLRYEGLWEAELDIRDERVEDELADVVNAWDRAMVTNDPEAIGAYTADDWTIIGPDGSVGDKASFLGFVRSGALTHSVMESHDLNVRVYGDAGDTAVVTARGISGGQYQGESFYLVERVSCVFVRQHGRWVCVLTHLSRIE